MKRLGESLDHFGVPLMEGVDIDVTFQHNGKASVAFFEVSGGSRIPGSREFPPETEDPDVQFIGAETKEDDTEIDYKEIDPKTMEDLIDSAVERYWDMHDRGELGSD